MTTYFRKMAGDDTRPPYPGTLSVAAAVLFNNLRRGIRYPRYWW